MPKTQGFKINPKYGHDENKRYIGAPSVSKISQQ